MKKQIILVLSLITFLQSCVNKDVPSQKHTLESEDADILSKDAYELHWLKIQSLITIGKKAEAMELLKSFVTVDGKYKATADSLLQTLK